MVESGKINIPCPKCLFEGIESKLSDPEKTEEGFVQTCERGHKLYLWSHLYFQDNLVVDLLEKKAYSFVGDNEN